jgi:phosphomannomutase
MIKRGIFKANDIRGITEGPDPEWDASGAYAIGAASVDVLDLHSGAGALVVGRDMRISGPLMVGAFIDGVLSRGVEVIDIGLSSTDQLWFASGWLDLPGAMFTASHNPAEYNGIKFCLAGAKPITSANLAEIAQRASTAEPTPAETPGKRIERDVLPAYADHLHSLVDLTASGRSGSWSTPATAWPVTPPSRAQP